MIQGFNLFGQVKSLDFGIFIWQQLTVITPWLEQELEASFQSAVFTTLLLPSNSSLMEIGKSTVRRLVQFIFPCLVDYFFTVMNNYFFIIYHLYLDLGGWESATYLLYGQQRYTSRATSVSLLMCCCYWSQRQTVYFILIMTITSSHVKQVLKQSLSAYAVLFFQLCGFICSAWLRRTTEADSEWFLTCSHSQWGVIADVSISL